MNWSETELKAPKGNGLNIHEVDLQLAELSSLRLHSELLPCTEIAPILPNSTKETVRERKQNPHSCVYLSLATVLFQLFGIGVRRQIHDTRRHFL